MRPISFYVKHPKMLLSSLLIRYGSFIPDSFYLRCQYRLMMGRKLNLSNPRAFTEKLQWLKLYNRQPIYTTMVDKYAVKKYVAEQVGEQYIIPTLGVWDSLEAVDWDSLPSKFVLKTTHGGGGTGVAIVRDKSTENRDATLESLKYSLGRNGYTSYREWPYKNVPRRIIAEPLLVDHASPNDLTDYKFFCFNGMPLYCQVIRDRSTCETIDFFDKEWNHMPFYGLNPKVKQASEVHPKPINFDDMLDVASKLSAGFPFLRVDLYNINGTIYFGEITFFPASGYGRFSPDGWDERLGKLIVLPSIME